MFAFTMPDLAVHDRRNTQRIEVDDQQIRYPTRRNTQAIEFLLSRQLNGVIHPSASERATKYAFACVDFHEQGTP